MCHKAACPVCHGVTWIGCGNHVPKVMDGVPKEEWCKCEPKIEKDGHQYPPKGSVTGVCIVF
ncbi:hypothetical protein SMAC4_13122 [Sordaria macrospora]|uniref:uncharacterized protein n=1 Tax=Sordaria macrospora TaxID=5147 RepID=UPI002B2A1D19|nr:hypothetical protein SMAC4_13122 [Sordaria macrospora]